MGLDRRWTVVPVPLTGKARQRGYNQSRLLADVISRELGMGKARELLERKRKRR